MAIYYLDFENGNDAADGLSWANAWKTFYSGASAARIAPGDTIRIAKSPDPTSLGQCTFTHASAEIAIPSGLVKNVDMCESGWTAAANVAVTHVPNYGCEGTNCLRITPATAFTTGKLAYKALAQATDFSAYEALSFFIRVSATTAAQLRLALCSDLAGDSVVDEFILTGGLYLDTPQWFTLLKAGGGALGAAIQSIALYADADPGSGYFYLDDIIAVGDGAAAADISLVSMIGIDDGEWYGIRSINDTTVVIEGGAARGYAGESATRTGYRRESILFTGQTTSTRQFTIQDSGSAGSPITFSGGWNKETNERDGYTFVRIRSFGASHSTEGVYVSGKTYISFEYLGLHRFLVATQGAWFICATSALINLSHCYAVANRGGGFSFLPNTSVELCSEWSDIHANGNAYDTAAEASYNTAGFSIRAASDTIREYNLQASDISLLCNGSGGLFLFGLGWSTFANVRASHNGSYSANSGVHFANHTCDVLFRNLITEHNYYAGVYSGIAAGNQTVRKFRSADNGSWGVVCYGGNLYLQQADVADANTCIAASAWGDCNVFCDNVHEGKNKTWSQGQGSAYLQQDVRYGVSGAAWRLDTNANANLYHPLRLLLAVVPLQANVQRVLHWYARRSSADLTLRIIVPGYQIAGMDDDVVQTVSAGADLWEELTMTLQATTSGVVEVYAEAYGAVASGFLDALH